MNKVIVANSVRFILLLLFQVLILKGINLNSGTFHYFHFIIYPVAILLLPIDLQRVYVLLLAFGLGISVDLFYNSPGLHAGAVVFMAYLRPYVLKWLEPRGGYSVNYPGLGNMEFTWMLLYMGICMFFFMAFYFIMEAFSMVYFTKIILNTIFSFTVSLAIILLYQIIARTKY